MTEIIKRTIENLNKNKMETFFVEDRAEALKMALSLLNEGDTVSVGGSVTLSEIGMLDALKRGNYNYLDRYAASSPLEMHEIFRKSFFADAYITSSNAVTENGELYNVDGNANRVAAMMYGPKKVIVIVGKNKIVKDLDAAVLRVKTVAAPLNCKRLNKETYCVKTGHCVTVDNGETHKMGVGCRSKDRICRNFTVIGEHLPDRIKVIIVNEDLGY